ncbi:Meiotic activator RIM4 [Wickerhamiella sorbophila]|uniref:Meiotic activator RIM4 n=1 Tax=Wickerhamiella sorbophila TaxID=45607 RepID=A0A2T0FMI7_9ASCO|nr:Meiotic activator RIM4 [Wickerhamiella sorbophila]PRT56204.1 Meiotic activator RIM4 [Wickerhamiella sorbophila]
MSLNHAQLSKKVLSPQKSQIPVAIEEPALALNSFDLGSIGSSDLSDTEFLGTNGNMKDTTPKVGENECSFGSSNAPNFTPQAPSKPNIASASTTELSRRVLQGLSANMHPSPISVSSPVADVWRHNNAVSGTGIQQPKAKIQERPRPDSCVFVGNLRVSLSDDSISVMLSNTFAAYGTVVFVKVLRDSRLSPYAFVQYEQKAEALRAIKYCNGLVVSGKAIRCEKANVNRTILIGPPPSNHDWEASTVEKICQKYGPIEAITPGMAEHQYWFVRFVYREDAVRAFTTLRMAENCTLDWVQNLADEAAFITSSKISSIVVAPLPISVTEDVIIDKFSRHGLIENVKLFAGENGDNCALIQYHSSEEAVVAIECACHTVFLGRTIRAKIVNPKRLLSPRFAIPPVKVPGKYSLVPSSGTQRPNYSHRGKSLEPKMYTRIH